MRRLLSLQLAPPDVDTYVLWCVDRGRHSTPPSVVAFSRRCEVERRDGCIVRGRSHESRLRISLAGVCEVVQALLVARRRDVPNQVLMVLLAGVCEMVQALVVDEAEGRAEPACAKWFRPCLLRDGGTYRTRRCSELSRLMRRRLRRCCCDSAIRSDLKQT
jgi:hypothetical protein